MSQLLFIRHLSRGEELRLNVKAGADTLIGGDGSDTCYVDNIGHVVTETNAVASTGGTDLIYSYLAVYTLETNVEYGRILATTAANMAGNTLNNVIYAGVGNNSLDGSNDSDTVDYVYATTAVAAFNLTVTTAQVTNGSGSDTSLNVENLNGSNFNDVLTGNVAANSLNGRTGLNTLIGGLGNDSYYINNISDVVTESSVLLTEIDTVYSAITYTLGANLDKT